MEVTLHSREGLQARYIMWFTQSSRGPLWAAVLFYWTRRRVASASLSAVGQAWTGSSLAPLQLWEGVAGDRGVFPRD